MSLFHYTKFLSTVFKSSSTVNLFIKVSLSLECYVFAIELKNHILTTPQHDKWYKNKICEKYTEL